MATMDRQFATLDKDGRLTLPSALTAKLGVQLEAEYEVTVEHEQIHLRPLVRPVSGKKFDETAINELRAMLRGGPSLEDELYAMRREEEARLLRKEQEWL